MTLLTKFDKFEDKYKIIQVYHNFVKQIKDREKLGVKEFIGSQPLQILPKDFIGIQKNTLITPKIDGKRHLMILTSNFIGFVDRGMNFYYPSNLKNKPFNLNELLDNDALKREVYKNLDMALIFDCEVVENRELLQVFIFDILFADILHDRLLHKQVVPFYRYNFNERRKYLEYHFQLLMLLESYLKNLSIKIYIKNFYKFSTFKEMTYENLIKLFNFDMNFIKKEVPEYDGAIFINVLYPYYLNPLPSYGQYKWKPKEKLTIDLKIKKDGNEWEMYSKGDKKIDIENIELYTTNLKEEYDGKVFEFVYDGKYIRLHEPVLERTVKGANAFMTIVSTIEAGDKFFDLKEIKLFYDVLHIEGKKFRSNWADKKTLIKLGILCDRKTLFLSSKEGELLKSKVDLFYKTPYVIEKSKEV
ncbi:MAG: hypothetical protein R3321_11475, partial [Nitrososphaeraceae archaeon]|nr:hypothetical protein [Nitrososphaeraceae archaeon]